MTRKGIVHSAVLDNHLVIRPTGVATPVGTEEPSVRVLWDYSLDLTPDVFLNLPRYMLASNLSSGVSY